MNTNTVRNVSKILKNVKVFIIPNSAESLSAYDVERIKENQAPFWIDMRKEDAQAIGTTFDPYKECAVQVWLTDDEHDNLTAHMGDDVRVELFGKTYDEFGYNRCIPGFIPYHMLEGKKEGDQIVLTFPTGVQVVATCCQSQFRYRRFGTFEDVLEFVKTVPAKAA